MATGTVILFKSDKGYGFIKPEDTGANIYVHVSAIPPEDLESFTIGTKVFYDVHTENDKISAINITLS